MARRRKEKSTKNPNFPAGTWRPCVGLSTDVDYSRHVDDAQIDAIEAYIRAFRGAADQEPVSPWERDPLETGAQRALRDELVVEADPQTLAEQIPSVAGAVEALRPEDTADASEAHRRITTLVDHLAELSAVIGEIGTAYRQQHDATDQVRTEHMSAVERQGFCRYEPERNRKPNDQNPAREEHGSDHDSLAEEQPDHGFDAQEKRLH